MSGMLAPMGILSGPMSDYFGQPVTEITSRFSWLTMGILVGAIIALTVFDWIRLRRLMMLVYGLIAISLVSLIFVENLTLTGIALGLVLQFGTGCYALMTGMLFMASRDNHLKPQ